MKTTLTILIWLFITIIASQIDAIYRKNYPQSIDTGYLCVLLSSACILLIIKIINK